MTILLFNGPRNPLSNLFRIKGGFHYKGHFFYSVEQAYQWRKADFHGYRNTAEKILALSDPYRIKSAGHFNTIKEWDREKVNIISELLHIKSQICTEFKDALTLSFPKVLVEDTGNEFWGRGKTGSGHNTLGCLLIQLRTQILTAPMC